jgi:TIR domain-containing protein
MPDVFISYRREDTSGYAGRLYDQISAHFGAGHVFMDVTTIEPGSDFVEVIEQRVGACDALIALIGKNWLTSKDEQNRVRLGRSGDFVSVEITAALKRNVEVVPLLVGGAKMPLQQELPESLQLLARHQAVEVSDAHFTRDVADLIQSLERAGNTPRFYVRKRIKSGLIAALLLSLSIAAGIGVWTWQKARHEREHAEATNHLRRLADPSSPVNPPKAAVDTNIGGYWRAVLQKERVEYEAYFYFDVAGGKLFGKAIYPTGEAGILNGIVNGDKISFITKHVPDFSEEEATFTIEGRISGNEIQIWMQDKDGLSKGIARRVAQLDRPRVLTH